MASVVAALDHSAAVRLGENGHLELDWVRAYKDFQSRILQLNFQLVRCSSDPQRQYDLCERYENIIRDLNNCLAQSCYESGYVKLWKLAYALIGYVRDIVDGKGEYALAYEMLCALIRAGRGDTGVGAFQQHRIDMMDAAKHAVRLWFVGDALEGEHPYGSWKDLKYLIYHITRKCDERYMPIPDVGDADEFIEYLIELAVERINKDAWTEKPSLCARWIPREKSKKFGYIFRWIAEANFKDWIGTATAAQERKHNPALLMAARRKAHTHFRKLLTDVNRRLNTPQIKQCAGEWAQIDFEKDVTSITLSKQRKAFMNVKLSGGSERSSDGDRVRCAENYSTFVKGAAEGKTRIKGARLSMDAFVRDALSFGQHATSESALLEKKAIDAQWEDNATHTNALKRWIAMVDVSGSMEMDDGKPLRNAIGLGIRIAEKSELGKRVLTFSSSPQWFNLESYNGFCEQVWHLKEAPWGGNTNIYAALDLILAACTNARLSTSDVADMVLVILSDMQIDAADDTFRDGHVLSDKIKERYAAAGLATVGEKWPTPHLLFWNLRSTDGFPAVTTAENVTMISGSNPGLMNALSTRGMTALKDYTPWTVLTDILMKPRYRFMTSFVPE